jgi:Zn finger protein HypA/HybF involved in hydrogenase expression
MTITEISAEWRRWIEAAKILAADPKAAVACPECEKGTLQVIDARQDAIKLDRYMQCPVCHAHNVMTLVDPDQSGRRQGAAESPKE